MRVSWVEVGFGSSLIGLQYLRRISGQIIPGLLWVVRGLEIAQGFPRSGQQRYDSLPL